jgi:putative membrane protein insertion efficiency factor
LACAYNHNYEGINYQKKSVFLITDENSEKSEDSGQEAEENTEDNISDKVAREAMVGTIGFYKSFISPLLPPACRFTPTCSQYGIQAIEEYGPQKGVILIAWRLLRCSPIGGRGYDPPRWPPVPYTYSSY